MRKRREEQEPEVVDDSQESVLSRHSRVGVMRTQRDCDHMLKTCPDLSQTKFQHGEQKVDIKFHPNRESLCN